MVAHLEMIVFYSALIIPFNARADDGVGGARHAHSRLLSAGPRAEHNGAAGRTRHGSLTPTFQTFPEFP